MEVKTSSFRRTFKVVVWTDDRGHERALIKILGPALWRGFGTLKVGNRVKLYDPKTNHVTVVSASMLGDAWMGSHFTNDDLVKETALDRHYSAKLLDKRTGDSGLGANTTFYRLALSPKRSAPVAWGKIVYTVAERGDTIVPVRAAYFRKKSQSEPSRVITFSKITELGGRKLPATMEVTVRGKPGEYTRIVYRKLKLGLNVPGSKFTEQALKK